MTSSPSCRNLRLTESSRLTGSVPFQLSSNIHPYESRVYTPSTSTTTSETLKGNYCKKSKLKRWNNNVPVPASEVIPAPLKSSDMLALYKLRLLLLLLLLLLFICSRQYTRSMHRNEVKLLLFVSDIAGSEMKNVASTTHHAVPMMSSALNVVWADRGLFTSKFLWGNCGDEFDQRIFVQT